MSYDNTSELGKLNKPLTKERFYEMIQEEEQRIQIINGEIKEPKKKNSGLKIGSYNFKNKKEK